MRLAASQVVTGRLAGDRPREAYDLTGAGGSGELVGDFTVSRKREGDRVVDDRSAVGISADRPAGGKSLNDLARPLKIGRRQSNGHRIAFTNK